MSSNSHYKTMKHKPS